MGALAQRGWEVVTDARRADRLDAAVARLGPAGARVLARGRRRDRSGAPGPARGGRRGALGPGVAGGEQRQHARGQSAAGGRPARPGGPAPDLRGERRSRRCRWSRTLLPHLAPGATVVDITSDAAVEAVRGMGGLRRLEGGAGAPRPGAGGRAPRAASAGRRPRRPADRDAPGRLPGRGHLRPARAVERGAWPACARSPAAIPAAATCSPTSPTADAGGVVTALLAPTPLGRCPLRLDPAHEAHEPPEARGLRRDGVRLLVSPGERAPVHARFTDLADLLEPGDLLVVNTSATVPAAIDGGSPMAAAAWSCTSRTRSPAGSGWWRCAGRAADRTTPAIRRCWSARDRHPAGRWCPARAAGALRRLAPAVAGDVRTRRRSRTRRLGRAADHLARFGRPIRYRHVPAALAARRLPERVRAPSRAAPRCPARPAPSPTGWSHRSSGAACCSPRSCCTPGVSSLEGAEDPYPEQYRVPALTAGLVNAAHGRGSRVVAVGTTVVRALETVTDATGTTHPGEGWTELVVSAERGVRAVDGLLTGWHEPEASHLWMLEAVAGPPAARAGLRGGVRGRLPVARVRRQPPAPALP